ncbi:MAG TPA: acyl-CoA dehydrogenase family protein [Ideonella sp.]|nr:acyl-CoA dehydrogenase family protein [Ideonella sp.]
MAFTQPDNQVPELSGYNLYATDAVLRGAVARGGAGWREAELQRQGAEYGAAATLRAAEDTNRHGPELHTHSRTGERIDEVRFHPAWHTMMAMARRNGIANLPWVDERPSAWVAHAASHYLHCQVESGSTCPTTMTKASVPALRHNAALYAALRGPLASMDHDERDLPLPAKRSMTLGMGMTERQGGSDLRNNTTRAEPAGNGPWGNEVRITGHKWFFSAPMSDAHLVLAREGETGLSCFYLPRWQPDGRKNPVHIQRLKDKVGNRSNASSEVEFHGAWGVRVGEPGRGIPTLIEMANYTRLDCALSSAAFMRQALVQALHHARHRQAFGKALIDQPLMTELLADLALEVEAATLLAMDLAERFGKTGPEQQAWCRLMTPAAKFWNCKRAVAFAGEAMEVLGGNGYVEESPMGRLFREAPVNSIWEGSGNVMCLDVLRAVARYPADAATLLDGLAETASQEPRLRQQVAALREAMNQPPAMLERQARQFTQQLVLCAQAGLMLRFASAQAAAAFMDTRFQPGWGAVFGAGTAVADARALLEAAWP